MLKLIVVIIIMEAYIIMYKCVVFDVDGTLIDTKDACNKSYCEFIEDEKLVKPSEEVLNSFFGLRATACFEILGVKGDYKDGLQKWGKIYSKYESNVKLYEDIERVLVELRNQGISLGIVTSRAHNELYEDRCFKPIAHLFDNVITCNDTLLHKPNPDPLLKFLDNSGYERNECIYIGDTIFDYECAKKANVDFYLAGWGTTISNDMKISRLMKVDDILRIVKK